MVAELLGSFGGAWLVPLAFLLLVALCVKKTGGGRAQAVADKKRQREAVDEEDRLGGGNNNNVAETDLEVGANASSITIVTTMADAPALARGDSDAASHQPAASSSSMTTSAPALGGAGESEGSYYGPAISAAAPPPSSSSSSSSAFPAPPSGASDGAASAELRKYSEIPAGVHISLQDSEFGGFLPLDGLPLGQFPSTSTDFSIFGDVESHIRRKKQEKEKGAYGIAAANNNGIYGMVTTTTTTTTTNNNNNNNNIAAKTSTNPAAAAAAALPAPVPPVAPSSAIRPVEPMQLEFSSRLGARSSVVDVPTLDMDYEYVSSVTNDKFRRESESDGPLMEGSDLYVNTMDFPRSSSGRSISHAAATSAATSAAPPSAAARLPAGARMSVLSTGSVFSEDEDPAEPETMAPPLSTSSPVKSAPVVAVAPASAELYVDLSNDSQAQEAARRSMSFPTRSDAAATFGKQGAKASAAAAATATSSPSSPSRPVVSVPEAPEMYVNMRESIPPSTTSALKSVVVASPEMYVDMSDANVPRQAGGGAKANGGAKVGANQAPYTVITAVDQGAAGGGEMYVDMAANKSSTTGPDRYEIVDLPPANARGKAGGKIVTPVMSLAPGFIPPQSAVAHASSAAASGNKDKWHSYVNTKDGVSSLEPPHDYVNTAANGRSPTGVREPQNHSNPSGTTGRRDDEDADGSFGFSGAAGASSSSAPEADHEYGNLGPGGAVAAAAAGAVAAAAAAASKPKIVATVTNGDPYTYNNAALSPTVAGSTMRSGSSGSGKAPAHGPVVVASGSADVMYVNNEESRRAAAAVATGATKGATSAAALAAPANKSTPAVVVQVPSEFYTNLMAGRPANEEWLVAPMDTGRYKALSQNKAPQSVVPECVRNKKYNRHLDVMPNPDTRVPLPSLPGDETSSYINANFIRDGSGNAKAYICTQAPMELTIVHFWRMIWEHNVPFIIMATGLIEKGEEKCQLYWPDEVGLTLRFQDISVTMIESATCNGYTRNVMEVECDDVVRKLTHWWFTAWPDHGVPRANGKPNPSQCVEMLLEIREERKKLTRPAPLLVHCSAGVGRSGSLVAMDVCMTLLEQTGHVDVAYVVYMIRHDRVALVQHPQQYELVHAACHHFAQAVGHPSHDDASATMGLDDVE